LKNCQYSLYNYNIIKKINYYREYFFVYSLAFVSNNFLFLIYSSAISLTRGSFGFGIASNTDNDNMIDDNFKAGDHAFFRISIQMAPEDEIFG
jgi:hypothetical protein